MRRRAWLDRRHVHLSIFPFTRGLWRSPLVQTRPRTYMTLLELHDILWWPQAWCIRTHMVVASSLTALFTQIIGGFKRAQTMRNLHEFSTVIPKCRRALILKPHTNECMYIIWHINWIIHLGSHRLFILTHIVLCHARSIFVCVVTLEDLEDNNLHSRSPARQTSMILCVNIPISICPHWCDKRHIHIRLHLVKLVFKKQDLRAHLPAGLFGIQ